MSSAGLPPVPASESPRSGISHEIFQEKIFTITPKWILFFNTRFIPEFRFSSR
jgi:hypothetical protein